MSACCTLRMLFYGLYNVLCCGSMISWYGSGSGSISPMYDPDPANIVSDLQNANKFFWLLLFEGTFTSFFKDKSKKKSQNIKNQCFSYYFCLMIEGSGAGPGSRSISLTNGSGSGRPKNIWILRIRILNTAVYIEYCTYAAFLLALVSKYVVSIYQWRYISVPSSEPDSWRS